MKKQTLFDLASMPKMVLSITLIVMLGLLFGAISYLLKTPKTDLPIVNPVVDSRCSEKVKIIGPCEATVNGRGYEFDIELGKCIEKKVIGSGCETETPFETLEECQEVCEEKEDVALQDENELIKCDNNSDCVLVNSGCCGCSMGGGMTCINKKYLENWSQKLRSDCNDNTACLAVYLCNSNPTGCECVNNVCQGVRGWEEI